MSEPLPSLPSFTVVAASSCHAHPARGAVAVCRRCMRPLCAECATRRDDLNFCADCVRAADAAATPVPGGAAVRDAQRRATRSGALLGTPARVAALLVLYFFAAVVAASWGVGMPFFANERRLQANKERVTDVQLALSSYYDDIGRYPSAQRGLRALLAAGDDDRDAWRGPYTTARAPGGNQPAAVPGAAEEVLDVFGHPVFYWATPDPDDPQSMTTVYVASRGANGVWDTPGIEGGNPPHEAGGDDVLTWVVWQ